MAWLATKFGLTLILTNLLATILAYSEGGHGPVFAATSTALCAVPALLSFDLVRYAKRCWRQDCLAD